MEAAATAGILSPLSMRRRRRKRTISIEKMLAHQLATCHFAAMNLYARVTVGRCATR